MPDLLFLLLGLGCFAALAVLIPAFGRL